MLATALPHRPDDRDRWDGRFHDRLVETVAHVTDQPVAKHTMQRLNAVPETDPQALTEALRSLLPGSFSVTGTLDRRLLIAEHAPTGSTDGADGEWSVADLSGLPNETRAWPAWTSGEITLADPGHWLSAATLTSEAARRLLAPRVLLTALYHPEWFPLPRFPLAISDLARAARSTLMGQVRLIDMQLGPSLADVMTAVRTWQPHIIGISATFGQHDLTLELLDHLHENQHGGQAGPLVVVGGSLTARNERLLLERYPWLLVARAAGEPTIADVIGYFHQDLMLEQVRGIGYAGAARGTGTLSVGRRSTATVPNRVQTDFLPELDLLDQTLTRQGVGQLEASRGCTNTCSFCPRGHKGTWAGGGADQMGWMLAAMGRVFNRHPDIARVLYLVDEEFIGRGEDAVRRALHLATTLSEASFAWESSCRIDQVVRLDRSEAWHRERAQMWRRLVQLGLRRMLFGVESGVTSILTRFNKETTSEQNALAIRTLSALGVPTRFTYITFDQLMTADELTATAAFQARTDLLLRPLPDLSIEEIVAGVTNPGFVAEHSVGQPFYRAISYMLVSMEPLIGAAYTRMVKSAGLAGAVRPSMGRVDARFADWRIGLCSAQAQLWVDRQFALDYTLKSLEKILDGPPRALLRGARVVIKDAAYALLQQMLQILNTYPALPAGREPAADPRSQLEAEVVQAMELQLRRLATALETTISQVAAALPPHTAALLRREHERWRHQDGWTLINASDPCGT
jgi:hypothetical protein